MANSERSSLLKTQHSQLQERMRHAPEREEGEEYVNGSYDAPGSRFNEEDREEGGGEEVHDDEDGEPDATPLLPIFSAAHLDVLPVYDLTHTVRSLVVAQCGTTLSWDQLRSPQFSQFLVKPVQQQIRSSHLSKATPYALMANCLQFRKEMSTSPGTSGTSTTRALLCELLAIKLLREFTTRELIDVLSYEFFPLQGMPPLTVKDNKRSSKWAMAQKHKTGSRVARVSTMEVAIRSQAKHFLAHPLVVQHLEAIWAGKIIFHSVTDSLYRPVPTIMADQAPHYGATGVIAALLPTGAGRMERSEQSNKMEPGSATIRRAVTLYDPREESVLKLSRLRVPRYRQFLSTCSFAVLLGLFVAVLAQRSLDITGLEVLFWFWSAGFMLDELVGFSEQGFSLYIMSFWNAFDLGILLLLGSYYCMRLYGILASNAQKHVVAHMAYDILAANAVLLFPRLFSALDHCRYFSQLLIAFRMMAIDLAAVLTLIVISCSGFFVAFTLSFGHDGYDASAVAYALFQMIMGFSPAAWTLWEEYNVLGRAILTLFLFITHFLVITILVTVLTNSFMAVVRNANEEHQFLFAVNTISLVKSDALFSYIAPTNIIGWTLTPLRTVLTLRQFVRLNRIIIKATHSPILLGIYTYECVVFRHGAVQPVQLIEQHTPLGMKGFTLNAPGVNVDLVGTTRTRLREPSIAAKRKDRALEEVFRTPFRSSPLHKPHAAIARRNTSNAVNDWMQTLSAGGKPTPPVQDAQSVVENPTAPRSNARSLHISRQRLSTPVRSVASNPEDFEEHINTHEPSPSLHKRVFPPRKLATLSEQIAAETLLSLGMIHNNNNNKDLIVEEGGPQAIQMTATSPEERQSMTNELMLARMNALEESFGKVLKELRDWREEERGLRV